MKNFISLLLISILMAFTTLVYSQEQPKQDQPKEEPKKKSEIKVAPRPTTQIPIKRVPSVPQASEKKLVDQGEENGPPPKLEVPEMTFDAGDVVRGDTIEHEFTLVNKGEGVLKVIRVQPTCGCTVTKYDSTIEPGKSGKIFVTVKTENLTGPNSKTINVQTNDPELGVFALTVKGNVKALLSVRPKERLSLGIVYTGTKREQVFDITSEDGQPFDVTQISVGDEKIQYNYIKAPDKKSGKLIVTIPADYPVGPIQANFTLKTTHPKVETISINLFGTMRESLSVFPQTLTFSGLSIDFVKNNKDSAELNKVITVRYETEASLEVKSVKSTLPFLDVTSEETQPKQAYSIKVHLNPDKIKIGPFDGAIVINTNIKTITIPVKGTIF